MEEEAGNSSTALLSSVLQSIPDLLTNPTLASAVFEAVRKGSRRVRSLPFISPLIPPITSVALIAESVSLRHDAITTCISLLAALVSRRATGLAASYVLDLTLIVRHILEHESTEPLLSFLPEFTATAHQQAASEHEASSLASAKVPPVPISPKSLEGVLWLLAAIILPTHKVHRSEEYLGLHSELPCEASSTQSESTESASLRLWRCIGGQARAAVLNLATSHVLLSGRCGSKVTIAAISVLERAFTLQCGCLVPATVRDRLSLVLETVLVEAGLARSNIDHSLEVRRALYGLARISVPCGRLPASVWITCGLRDAVCCSGDLGKILRSWSRNGLISYNLWSKEKIFQLNQRLLMSSNVPPPRKKRRVGSENSENGTLSAPTPMGQSEEYNFSLAEARRNPTAVLKCELQTLEDINCFTEDVKAVNLLVRVTSLTADYLAMSREQEPSMPPMFHEWLTFATSISNIIRDVSSNVNLDAKRDMWDALLLLETEGLMLLASFHRVKRWSLSKSRSNFCDAEQTSLSNHNKNLGSSVISVLNTASLVLESAPENLPMKKLSRLLWDFGDMLPLISYSSSDLNRLSKTIQRFRTFFLTTTADLLTLEIALLLKGTFHVCARLTTAEPFLALDGEFETLKILLSANISKCPQISAAVFLAKADLLCASVGCNGVHESLQEDPRSFVIPRMTETTWGNFFNEASVIVKGTGVDELIAAATHCLGRLVFHAPLTKVGEAAALLIRTLWHPTCQKAREYAISTLRSLVSDYRRDPDVASARNHASSAAGGLHWPEDSWDEIDVVFAPKGDANDISRLLGVELRDQVNKLNKTLQEGNIWRTDDIKMFSLSMVAQLPYHDFVTSKVIGLSCESLISTALSELTSWPSFTAKLHVGSQESESTIYRNGLKLRAWHHLVSFVARQSDEQRCSRNTSNLPETFMPWTKSASGRLDIVLGQLPLTTCVANFLNLRMKDWLPFAFHRLLHNDHLTRKITTILMLPDPQSLWRKVSRHAMGHLIRAKDSVGLEALSLRVNESVQDLVHRACPDALARAAMLHPDGIDLSSKGPNALIQATLKRSLQDILCLHAGKIVQRIVMEIGGYRSESAENALHSISMILRPHERSSKTVAAALVSDHFMLVMDAVNRGLFHSKATERERCRFLRMLSGVISIASEYLHLYIPKVLATLKLALDSDRGSTRFQLQTLRVWVNFLECPPSRHILPHLGLILCILIPFVHSHGDIICSTLEDMAEKAKVQKNCNLTEIALLLRLAGHKSLAKMAKTLETSFLSELETKHTGELALVARPSTMQLRPGYPPNIIETCRSVGKIITQHENGSIELLAVDHLLQILRQNRNLFDEILQTESHLDKVDSRRHVGVIASLLRIMVETLGRSKNKQCQDKVMQCIGEVGGLDPVLVSRFDKASSERTQSVALRTHRSCPKRIHALVAVLLDDFLAPALAQGEKRGGFKNQVNRLGMVIQELLRIAGCKKDTAFRASKEVWPRTGDEHSVDWDSVLVGKSDEENAIFFWDNLKNSTRSAVQPYLEELFNIDDYKGVFGGNAGDVGLVCEPVWLKVKATSPVDHIPSAHDWRRQMVVQLVDYVGNQGKFGETLKALRPVLRYEDNVTAFIFPLAVLTALDTQRRKRSAELEKFLAQEIALVLDEGTSPQPIFDLMDTLRHWREERCHGRGRLISIRAQQEKSSAGAPNSAGKKRNYVQVNIEKERRTDSLSPFVDLDGWESETLSLLVQARAAFSARSYARAVLLAECHIRNLRKRRDFHKWPALVTSLRAAEGQQGRVNGASQRESFSILQKSFAELEDAESMAGIASLRAETSLLESVIDAEAAGSYDKALVTYERALAEKPRKELLHTGFLSCLMTLGHWETMLSHAEGLVSSSNLNEMDLRHSAQSHGIEAAWRLKRWDKVRSFGCLSLDGKQEIQKSGTRPWMLDFNICFGKMIYSLQQGDSDSVILAASKARSHLLEPAIRLAREGYARAYPVIVLMQTVSEVEDATECLIEQNDPVHIEEGNKSCQSSHIPRLVMLHGRTRAMIQSLRTKEPLLTTRKVCFEILGKPVEAARISLELASLANASGNLRAASACAFESSKIASSDESVVNAAAMRMAQIRHEQGDAIEALLMIRKEIERLLSASNEEIGNSTRKKAFEERLCTANVVAGRWIEETRSEPAYVIQECYEQASLYDSSREEPFYALGRHYDTLLQARAGEGDIHSHDASGGSSRSSRRSRGGEPSGGNFLKFCHYVPLIIKCFTKALCNGHTRLYDALPRMMTVWFDYHSATDCPDPRLGKTQTETEINREIKSSFESIPGYMWVTVVPQLMSRVLHPKKLVRDYLENFLARITCLYPDQTTWMIWPACHLNNKERRKAANHILTKAATMVRQGKILNVETRKNEDPSKPSIALKEKMHCALGILRGFVEICLAQIDKNKKSRSYDFSQEFRGLKHNLKLSPMMNPMIPTLAALTVRLPSNVLANHRPFVEEPVRISDLENEALVMSSAMKPRRITLVGTDGRQYRYLAKQEASGDMRKDSRLIEFITVVNRLLSKDPLSKKRDISLKTYAVLPLTEEAGMIEWVNDLAPLRQLVQEHHKRLAEAPDMRTTQLKYQKTKERRRFHEWALTMFPPVLNSYFLENYGAWSDPQIWLEARNLWTQSVAVWSMTGYVVGLGDRHGENILIETTTGRCVHVDFAMLFDKGTHLRVPEVVPFRLTPNMVTAMGIAGYEGVFRSIAETVLRILRGNTEGLLGVLESFLYDPLADWSKSDMKGAHGNVQVIASKEAWEMRDAVKAKLGGLMDDSQLPLSIEGQVQRLIHEATSIDNLSKMYIWWSGWI